MCLAKKLDQYIKKIALKKWGEDYRHAYELLDITKLEGLKELQEAPKEDLMELCLNKYSKTWNTLIQLSIGSDPRIGPICDELNYSNPETKLFFYISRRISYCKPVTAPPKKIGKLKRKGIEKVLNYFLKRIEKKGLKEPGDKELFDLLFKFCSDGEYYQKMMDKFYKKIIPRLEEKNKL